MASTTDVVEALKYTYGVDQVLYLVNQEVVCWNMFQKAKKPVGGRGQFLMPIMVKNPGAWTGISEGGALPSNLNPDTAEASFSLTEFAGLYNMSWKLLQDARNSKFAFQTALKMMEAGFRRRILKLLNADLLSDGLGKLAVLPAADDQTTVTVNALPSVDVGMVVDVMDTGDNNTKHGNSLTVTAVDAPNRTITLSGAPSGTAAGDYVVIQDTVSSSSSLHTNGLLGIIDDADPPAPKGDFGGIDRGTAGNEFWESVVLDNGGTNRALTEDLLMQLEDSVREKGGASLNSYISNLPIIRRYHELLREDAFFAMSSPKAFDGGSGVGRSGGSQQKGKDGGDGRTIYRFSGNPWHAEPYFAANTIIGLDTKHFFIGHGENAVPRPASEIFDGTSFFRQTSNATFEVAWYWQGELLSDNPAAGAKIEDVAES
jgi:hypothetical protein|tara:strand:+ start:1240 stop:2526 length:1287 start_codon:yes stop_codon:yes gene_type:complete